MKVSNYSTKMFGFYMYHETTHPVAPSAFQTACQLLGTVEWFSGRVIIAYNTRKDGEDKVSKYCNEMLKLQQ